MLKEIASGNCSGIEYSYEGKNDCGALARALKRLYDIHNDGTLHWSNLSMALAQLNKVLKELGIVLVLEEQE